MKAGKNGKSEILEKLKNEISAQVQDQDEVIQFSFQEIDIGTFTPEIKNLFNKYPKLLSLEFNSCKIKSLDNFPKIPALVKLCLEENDLSGSALSYIATNYPELQFLSLSGNKISTFEDLKCLSQLKQLQQLDLQENPCSKLTGYRDELFKLCPSLEVLDNKDKEGNEVDYDEDSLSDEEELTEDDDDEDNVEEDEEDDDDEEDDEEEEAVEPLRRKKQNK